MGIIALVLLAQCFIAVIVIAVLKRLLERELIEAGFEQLQAALLPAETPQVTVRSALDLKPETRGRAQAVLKRKAADIKIIFTSDPALKGGIVFEWPGGNIDCSLADRLKNL